jgi:hypothetical protein
VMESAAYGKQDPVLEGVGASLSVACGIPSHCKRQA